jgi:hypothetical protein
MRRSEAGSGVWGQDWVVNWPIFIKAVYVTANTRKSRVNGRVTGFLNCICFAQGGAQSSAEGEAENTDQKYIPQCEAASVII